MGFVENLRILLRCLHVILRKQFAYLEIFLDDRLSQIAKVSVVGLGFWAISFDEVKV
jgi:hypothetical protein